MEEHTADLYNVREGDTVRFTTTEGKTIRADCVNREKQHSTPEAVNITETSLWKFEAHGLDGVATLYASITNGLSGTEGESPYPDHSAVWNKTAEVSLGYIEELEIFGQMDE